MTGLLRGGPCDGLQMEIEPGQEHIDLEMLAVWGPGAAEVELPRYRYVGEVTPDGLAVYEPDS